VTGDEAQLSDELLGQVVAAVRPARPAGHGASWEALAPVKAEVTGWVKDGLTLVKIGELLERRGIVVPYRTLARSAAAECGYSSSRQRVTVPVADGEPGEEVQIDFGYLGMIPDGDRRRKLHALVFTAVFSRYCFVYLTFSQTTIAVIAGCEAAWGFFAGMAAARGQAIGIYAARILDTDLPWTKMRVVYTLIGLCRTCGNEPVEQACAAALELDVISVPKVRSIVEKGTGATAAQGRRPRAAGRPGGPRGHHGAVRP
jgi:hypothetical protein